MAGFENRIDINAPADKVFEYVADLTRHPEWAKYPLTIAKTSEGPVGAGSTFQSEGKQFGTHKDSVRIVEYDPPRRVSYEAVGDAGSVRHFFAVEESGGATTLRKGVEFVKPAMLTKIFMPVVKMVAPKTMVAELARIKSRIEGSA